MNNAVYAFCAVLANIVTVTVNHKYCTIKIFSHSKFVVQ